MSEAEGPESWMHQVSTKRAQEFDRLAACQIFIADRLETYATVSKPANTLHARLDEQLLKVPGPRGS